MPEGTGKPEEFSAARFRQENPDFNRAEAAQARREQAVKSDRAWSEKAAAWKKAAKNIAYTVSTLSGVGGAAIVGSRPVEGSVLAVMGVLVGGIGLLIPEK